VRTVLPALRAPVLLLLLPPALRGAFAVFARVFGATMTSASGEIFANGEVFDGAGVSEVTTTFAVDVGERCNASGCICSPSVVLYVGFGSARICDKRLSSRNVAWSSMTATATISLIFKYDSKKRRTLPILRSQGFNVNCIRDRRVKVYK